MTVTIIPRGRKQQSAFFRTTLVNDSSPGTCYLSTEDLYRPGNTNLGLRFQAKGASVAIAYTLMDPLIAVNPTTQANVTWDTIGNVTNDYLDDGGRVATAVRFTFSGVSEVSVACI